MKDTRVILVLNMKGGTAKTTTTLNLGAALANTGKRVLLLDTDPQESLTLSIGFKPREQKYTLMDALKRIHDHEEIKADYGIMKTDIDNLEIISGSEKGEKLENILGMNPTPETRKLLKAYVEEQRGKYDYILIDSGPSLRTLTINGLVAADSVIIPCEPEAASAEGLQKLIKTIFDIKKKLNPTLGVEGVLITRYNAQKGTHKRISQEIREAYGDKIKIFDFHIPYSSEISNAAEAKKDIFSMRNKGAACTAYELLACEVDGRTMEMDKLSLRKQAFVKKVYGAKEVI